MIPVLVPSSHAGLQAGFTQTGANVQTSVENDHFLFLLEDEVKKFKKITKGQCHI